MATATQPQTGLERIALQQRGRGLCLGITGSGKSVLEEKLFHHWLATQPRPRVLILDSKPRFRAQWELSGFSASHRYKKWRRGPSVPGSYALDFTASEGVRGQLRQVWRLGSHIAIAQAPQSWRLDAKLMALRAAAAAFYNDSRDSYSQLVVVDELADFFNTSGFAKAGDELLQIVRSGREMNVALLGACQRPKGLPKSFLTELGQAYVFRLVNDDDMEHLEEMGLPGTAAPPDQDFTFLYFARKGNDLIPRARLAL